MATKPFQGSINGFNNGWANQPNVGTDNAPSFNPTSGYNNSSPTSTALNVPTSDDYTGWNWEQILNGVLGFSLPARNQVTDLRWTVTDSGTGTDNSLFMIFSETGFTKGSRFSVYLNPGIMDQGGPWDAFYNVPSTELATAVSNGPSIPGVLDPKDFATAAAAVAGVQSLYAEAVIGFGIMDLDLNSEASEFKGQAGQAFQQLIDNLNTNAESIYTQMVRGTDPSGTYSAEIGNSGQAASDFMLGLWNALSAWTSQRLDWLPVGAIFQALLDGGVITSSGSVNNGKASNGPYTLPNIEGLTRTSFGNLLSDAGWLAVEAAAKDLWNAAVASSLDQVAQPLITNLADSFLTTASILQPLQAPGMNPIGVNANSDLNTPGANLNTPAANLNTPAANLNTPAANLNTPGANLNTPGADLNTPAGALGGPGAGLNTPGADLNTPSADLATPGAGMNTPAVALGGPGAGLNTPATALGNPGAGLNGPAGLNTPAVALATPGAGLNTPATALGNPGAGLNGPAGLNTPATALGNPGTGLNGAPGLNTPSAELNVPPGLQNPLTANPNTLAAALGTTPAAASGLQNALDDSKAEEKQLKKALSLAPSSGPLHDALENALADNSQEQKALQGALNGTTPVGEALNNALADNGKARAAIGQALNSGEVPKTGPLRTALEKAAGDNTAARQAADKALSATVPGGGALHKALADNGRAASELRHALTSGQVPRTGPLHDTLTKALADVTKARHAADQALAGGGAEPSSIQHALADNKAAQTELQHALAQVPKTGALHNELASALADTRQTGAALHQALSAAGVAAEPGRIGSGPTAGLGDLASLLRGGKGMVPGVGGGAGLSAGLGGGAGGAASMPGVGANGAAGLGAAGVNGAGGVGGLSSGLSGGAAGGAAGGASGGGAAGAGQADAAQAAAGEGAVPFSTPMAGGGMGMGGGQGGQSQERERTTWLSEDEDVWGTDPGSTPSVLGRDFADDEDELDDYEDYAEPAPEPRRAPTRAWGR